MKKDMLYLVPNDYMTDTAVHVFHDWESGEVETMDNGGLG